MNEIQNWYVASVKPNCERQVKRRLENQDFTVYLPMLNSRRFVLGEMRERLLPLFPGYIFIFLDVGGSDDHWKAACSTMGIINLLPCSEWPLPIATADVEGLKEAEGQGLFRTGAVQAGEKVRVFRGALAGHVLECIHVAGERLRCLWYCLGTQRVVRVPLANVTVLR